MFTVQLEAPDFTPSVASSIAINYALYDERLENTNPSRAASIVMISPAV